MTAIQGIAICALLAAPILAGFDMSRHSIPPEKILGGGPPKDGIPAILQPRFIEASIDAFLKPDDVVIGVAAERVAKAYPLRILNWHEIVNDELRGTPIAVTYCPLTASAVVYERRVGKRTLSFGVSGKLYQSNVLMYDHQTESLWSQLREEAVTGPLTGTHLAALPSVTTTWADWRAAHPDTFVLSPETGHPRDYGRDPYAAYRRSPEVMFPPEHVDRRLAPKEKVFGLHIAGLAKAYPLRELAKEPRVEDHLGSHRVRVEYDAGSERVTAATLHTNRPLVGVVAYWFAWSAFHPGTALWKEGSQPPAALGQETPMGEAEGSHAVAIVSHAALWTDIPGFLALSQGDASHSGLPSVLVLHGELRNRLQQPLGHVRLAFELLDRRGRVVASETGFNHAAETLRPLDSPVAVGAVDPPVVPIPPASTDTFRMIFLRDETPEFAAYRVRVIEAVPASDR